MDQKRYKRPFFEKKREKWQKSPPPLSINIYIETLNPQTLKPANPQSRNPQTRKTGLFAAKPLFAANSARKIWIRGTLGWDPAGPLLKSGGGQNFYSSRTKFGSWLSGPCTPVRIFVWSKFAAKCHPFWHLKKCKPAQIAKKSLSTK